MQWKILLQRSSVKHHTHVTFTTQAHSPPFPSKINNRTKLECSRNCCFYAHFKYIQMIWTLILDFYSWLKYISKKKSQGERALEKICIKGAQDLGLRISTLVQFRKLWSHWRKNDGSNLGSHWWKYCRRICAKPSILSIQLTRRWENGAL